MRDLAGKQIRGETRTAQEQKTLDGFALAFPDLQNPIFVRCSIEAHVSYGVLLFADEIADGSVKGNIRFASSHAICTECGDAKAVIADRVDVVSR
ncbi:MAG TPA: hypothetical protein VGQ36_24875 [Thermoanaerobaculia bacterium]|nr:hypothetical protein [Thermoanaerobaculia bacterium]